MDNRHSLYELVQEKCGDLKRELECLKNVFETDFSKIRGAHFTDPKGLLVLPPKEDNLIGFAINVDMLKSRG